MFKWIRFKLWCFFHRKFLKELKTFNHCSFNLEHHVLPDISYNDYIREHFNV